MNSFVTKFKLFESAPRLPKDVNYWLKKGKSGKDVCLILHDDMDGCVSGIIMKNYLLNQGFSIKKYAIINYTEGWKAFKLDPTLINIALDFAEDLPNMPGVVGLDYYCDHHGRFSEEVAQTQKKYSIKTPTGSAAEGIAQQLGVPFSNDTKDWIDMIDSAKYSEYEIDIRGILEFDLKEIKKDPKRKLKFAASLNQLLKRSDHKTFIEVVNASEQPSIYNIYRLFKLFYPKNNPNFRTNDETDFVGDAKVRLAEMKKKTKGTDTKVRFMSQNDFWKTFAANLPYQEYDDEDEPIIEEDPTSSGNYKPQVKPNGYQLIGNLMFVPSGTWANALRAKAIFNQDVDSGLIPDDPKLNFVLLQYGNTLQIADLRTPIKSMSAEDLPKDKNGKPIDNLGKYTESLVENFRQYLGFPTEKEDDRIKAGGHWGIGSISNIFGKCKIGKYKDIRFLDLFKNKIINDISGVKWDIQMIWSEEQKKPKKAYVPKETNKKMMDIGDVRSEESAIIEKDEREILNYLIINDVKDKKLSFKFKDDTLRKIYNVWLDSNFSELEDGTIKPSDLDSVYFNKTKKIEKSQIFNDVVDAFGFTDIYNNDSVNERDSQRKELKRILKVIFNMYNLEKYIKTDTEEKVDKWNK